MRIVVVVILALVGLGARAEAKCKAKGKLLFAMEQAPLDGFETQVPNAQVKIYATGAWSRVQEMPDGQEPASQGGCLSKAHLKELKRTVRKAKFRLLDTAGQGMCRALTTTSRTYRAPGRKKKVTVSLPCGTVADEWTENLAACTDTSVLGTSMSAADIRAICRGTS